MNALVAWLFRGCWVAAGLLLGVLLADRLDDPPGAIGLLVPVVYWVSFAGLTITSFIPIPAALTLIRVVGPCLVALGVWVSLDGDALAIAGTVAGAGAMTLSLFPHFGDVFVNGPSYGNERRFALRPPLTLLLGPIEIAWFLGVAGILTGPLLLAAEQWIAGAIVLVLGFPFATLALRSLHVMSRRWLVFVPNGVVVHDALALDEPVLFLKKGIAAIYLLEKRPDASVAGADLTRVTTGPVVALDIAPAGLPLRGNDTATSAEVELILVSPSLPGPVLKEGSRRGYDTTPLH